MNDCKENVLEMIDEALSANRRADFCICRPGDRIDNMCAFCKINTGLSAARACIVASVGRIDVMRSNMVAMQAEIEAKLKALLEEV